MLKDRSLGQLLAAVCALSTLVPSCAAAARGASPYLPLNLSPRIERQIERVLLLADKPIMRRPIAAATVFDALPKACAIDAELCASVRRYLNAYMQPSGITLFEVELAAATGDSGKTIPNARGNTVDSSWQVAASAFYQVNDYVILNAGGVAYEGRATPTGSMLSAGFDFAQLDVGFRDHWFSPLSDSTSLIGTQAPTMPSITLSNYAPLTVLGINYEVFLAEMSRQDGILYRDSTTSGKPRLTGMQLGIEPVSGYGLTANRLFQFGGGARGYGGLSGLIDAFTGSKDANRPDSAESSEFGNQVASLASSISFPGEVPFSVRVEYAGEDNAYAEGHRLGATSLSLGIEFPELWRNFDFSLEASEWQVPWYVHHLYPKGLTNHDHVIGHWFGDERRFGDTAPGSSQMLRLGWTRSSGDYFQATYRTLHYQRFSTVSYERMQELALRYSKVWRDRTLDAEIAAGRDVFGESFARLSLSVDFAAMRAVRAGSMRSGRSTNSASEVFVDLGANYLLSYNIAGVETPIRIDPTRTNPHAGVGARRRVSQRNDLGVRLEFDRFNDYQLLSLRALDYRFRFNGKIAVGAFAGVGRYDFGLPAYGYFWGAGVQLMDLFPKWDLSVEARQYDKLGRDKMLPNDPPVTPGQSRIFFDLENVTLHVSRRF
jgi:hypothetical protein